MNKNQNQQRTTYKQFLTFHKMGVCCVLAGLCFSTSTWAQKAHTHGEAQIQIAFEDQKGQIQWQVTSEAIVGFEHKGKNEAQKKQLQERLAQLEKAQGSLYELPESCQVGTHKVQQVFEDGPQAAHSEIHVQAEIECQQSVTGKILKIKIGQVYPKVQHMRMQIDSPSGAQNVKAKQSHQIKL